MKIYNITYFFGVHVEFLSSHCNLFVSLCCFAANGSNKDLNKDPLIRLKADKEPLESDWPADTTCQTTLS